MNIHDTVQKSMPLLNASERKVAKIVLSDPYNVIHMTLKKLSIEAEVGDATIVRFCQKIGLKGYQELKLLIAQDLPNCNPSPKVKPDSEIEGIIERVQEVNKYCIEDSAKSVDGNQLEIAADLILNAKKVCCFGIGGSGLTALDAFERFRIIGIDCYGNSDTYYQKFALKGFDKNDVAIGISFSGQKQQTNELLRYAKENGVSTIGITGNLGTTMTEYCDVVLCTSIREAPGGTFITRIAQCNVLDMLFSLIIIKKAKQGGNPGNETLQKFVKDFY